MQREYMQHAADLDGVPGSPWLAADSPQRPTLEDDLSADVVVVGAGLAGACAARELAMRGLSVVVLERSRIACATTGHSTAKVTVVHGTDWTHVLKSRGLSGALVEWAARNYEAAESLGSVAAEAGIACRYRALDTYLCERPGAEGNALAREWNALRALGLPVEDVDAYHDSPMGPMVAVRMPSQAQFDPAAFTAGVLATLPENRTAVFENSPVRTVAREGEVWRAYTDAGTVTAPIVVMASLAPARDPAVLFARLFPYAHYAIEAMPVREVPDGIWIQASGSELTARPVDDPGGSWILSGASTRLGHHADEHELFRDLIEDSFAEFAASPALRYWSAEDFSTPDGLPFVGRVGPREGLYYLGGFGGWGMTKSYAAAELIADEIEGIASPGLLRLLSPNRFPRLGTWSTLLRENLVTARHLLLPHDEQLSAAAAVPPVVPAAGDEPPRCTHMGCRTKVNTVERTLDCPCHGSRFTAEGYPLYGPARRNVRRPDVEDTVLVE